MTDELAVDCGTAIDENAGSSSGCSASTRSASGSWTPPRSGADGRWRLPGDLDGRLPLFFSILAEKRATAA